MDAPLQGERSLGIACSWVHVPSLHLLWIISYSEEIYEPSTHLEDEGGSVVEWKVQGLWGLSDDAVCTCLKPVLLISKKKKKST